MNYPHLKKMRYSLAVGITESGQRFDTEENLATIKANADQLFDILFTSRVAPFTTDAHALLINQEDADRLLEQMLNIQEATGVAVSPIFNNIFVPNTKENLDVFIDNFRPLYERGVRSITQPHLLWMLTGRLQQAFPELMFKDTVLRETRSAQDFWNHAEAGYSYVNIDRRLARDEKELREIHRAQNKFFEKTGRYVYTSLLIGELCMGHCPLWREHYQHTLTNSSMNDSAEVNLQLFLWPARFSCIKRRFELNTKYDGLDDAGLPYISEDLDHLCQYFDVIKLPGRRLTDALNRFVNEIVHHDRPIFLREDASVMQAYLAGKWPREFSRWRKAIKNCRYQCWDCSICADLFALAGEATAVEKPAFLR